MGRQQLEGAAHEFVPGYEKKLQHTVDRRLRVLSPEEAERVRAHSPVVSTRMLLGVKKDGSRKARLVLQGFKKPTEWDTGSNASPVAYRSTVRSLVFMGGEGVDVLSSIDISVAFLQSELYGPDETPRYVSYKPYAGASEYVFQLRGPVYGQRSAPRAWYSTVTQWLVQKAHGSHMILMAARERSYLIGDQTRWWENSLPDDSGQEGASSDQLVWRLQGASRIPSAYFTEPPRRHKVLSMKTVTTGGDIWVWRLSVRKADAIRSSSAEFSTRRGSWSQPWLVHMRAVGTVISMLLTFQRSSFGFSLRHRIPNVLSISELQQARLGRCSSICEVCSLLSSSRLLNCSGLFFPAHQ